MTQEKPSVLDLFSGIGGFSLGLDRAGFRTIAFCEIEPFCQKILKKHWPETPIARDIRQLNYTNGALYDGEKIIYKGKIDLICGGFPCQPFSVAGRKKGTEDDRDLWPQMFRLIQQIQPTWIIGENVANFVNMAFSRTKIDLESQGYTVQPFIIPACAVGAPHRRDRVWIIANSPSQRHGGRRELNDRDLREQKIYQNKQNNRNEIRSKTPTSNELCSVATNCSCKRCQSGSYNRQERSILHDQHRDAEESQRQGNGRQRRTGSSSEITSNNDSQRAQGLRKRSLCGKQEFSWCKDVRRPTDYFNRPDIPKPLICRSDHGFSSRVDRLKSLGNAVVPQIPEIIGQAIIKSMKVKK